jgi:hypothetical protein
MRAPGVPPLSPPDPRPGAPGRPAVPDHLQVAVFAEQLDRIVLVDVADQVAEDARRGSP